MDGKENRPGKIRGKRNTKRKCGQNKLKTKCKKSDHRTGHRDTWQGEAGSTSGNVLGSRSEEGTEDGSWVHGEDYQLFPRHTIWLVHLVTLLVRLNIVCSRNSWWILHPDEIFQSLEVAHSEVYGYGFRPYEFLPPPDVSSNSSVAEHQEAALGMFALRPFLFPRVFMLVFHIKEMLGIKSTPYLVGKIFHGFIAAHLPLSVYFFSKSLPYSSEDMAVLAAMLVSMSQHLTVLGTHTLINSFLSPWLFCLLTVLMQCISNTSNTFRQIDNSTSKNNSNPTQIPKQNQKNISNKDVNNLDLGMCKVPATNGYIHRSAGSATQIECIKAKDHNENVGSTSGLVNSNYLKTTPLNVGNAIGSKCNGHTDVGHKNEDSLISNGNTKDQTSRTYTNGHIIINNGNLNGKLHNGYYKQSPQSYKKGVPQNYDPAELHCAMDVEFNLCNGSAKPAKACHMYKRGMLEQNGKHSSQYKNHDNSNITKADNKIHAPLTDRFTAKGFSILLSSCALGLLCYMRVDLLAFTGIVLGLLTFPWKTNIRIEGILLGQMLTGFFLGLFVGGLDDLYSYDHWFITPWQWFAFNIQGDLATKIFGWRPGLYYVYQVFGETIQAKFVFAGYVVCITCINIQGTKVKYDIWNMNKIALKLSGTVFLLLGSYSGHGHKEVRFVHNVIVMYFITVAYTITLLFKLFLFNKRSGKVLHWMKSGLYTILILNCIGTWWAFPSPVDESNGKWSYKDVWDSNHINECLHFIGQQPDAHGVFLDRSLHITGSYSILHRDIPIFTLVHYEFNEFDKASRKFFKSRDLFANSQQNVSTSILSRISNFISIENTPLLLKYLIKQPEYNYLLIKKSRKLIQTGFKEVYQSGTMRVMKRSRNARENSELEAIGDVIPLGSNATVLEYEGSWLNTYGLPQLASQRLEAAIELDPTRIRAYQLLAFVYQSLGLVIQASHVTQQCYEKNSRSLCNEVYPKVVLHSDLVLDVTL